MLRGTEDKKMGVSGAGREAGVFFLRVCVVLLFFKMRISRY